MNIQTTNIPIEELTLTFIDDETRGTLPGAPPLESVDSPHD